MTTDQTIDRSDKSFSTAFFNALVAAMTEACESRWLIAAVPDAALAPGGPERFRIKLALDGSLRGNFLIEIRRAEAAMLAAKLLRQSAGTFEAEENEALLKLVETAMSKFRSALEQEYGVFTIEAASAPQPPSEGTKPIQTTIANEEGNRASLLMYLDAALAEALALHAGAGSAVANAGKSPEATRKEEIQEQVNLDLVMDVELNVTLRFGQRHLTLREVLELTSGSVVELDRQVEEPIELILNNKVIARGEAVVIDGNYGLRVTEVLQPASFPDIPLGAEVGASASEIMRQQQNL